PSPLALPPLPTRRSSDLQDLLPQLRWLTVPNYDHVYYVDLTPKVTDARIFTPDADHPGGWGTILIGGFRLGGSCTNCTSGKGTRSEEHTSELQSPDHLVC